MKKMIAVFSFLMMCVVSGLNAQHLDRFDISVNYDSIEMIVTQEGVYDDLLGRFQRLDTTLTGQELAYVFYGFGFQPGYKGSADYLESPVRELLDQKNYKEAWDQGLKYLEDNPVSLITLERLTIAAYYLRDELSKEEVYPIAWKYFTILSVISSSGDGKTRETAFKIISVNDEYVFMAKELKASRFKRQGKIDKCDYFTINAPGYDSNEIYFDATLPLELLYKQFGE